MSLELLFVGVGILLFFAVLDLMVGVSNDAVNFLNSSIGSRVAPRHIIMIIASFGIIAGVLFSSGMMEVARKGIFHPQFFTMPELMCIFLGVMLADILILDIFNTFGLPTSTTVSIVFELLGAAVALSILKIIGSDQDLSDLGQYINTAKAMTIIFGILLSVAVAFFCGMVVQFFSRLLFTFDYEKRLPKYGAIWGGFALSVITLFILIKGAKGASFLSAEEAKWIKEHSFLILGICFAFSAVLLHGLFSFFKMNMLKPIVLVGTFALALAFAANDLVNFIGVPLAGLHAYTIASASDAPLTGTMEALSGKVQSQSYLLLIAGAVMVITLWFSRKARTVADTEINLSRQEEGLERFESIALSRVIVRMACSFFDTTKILVPASIREKVNSRFDRNTQEGTEQSATPPFDLVRASVNLMVASAVVSWATSMKLPLSTTYVTFMVAMGTSFADRAWDRESAVYRVTGVLTVVSGWFMTALIAFSTAFIFAGIIFFLQAPGVIALMALAGFTAFRTHFSHKERAEDAEKTAIFNLKKVENASEAVSTTFEHTAYLLQSIRQNMSVTLEALFTEDLSELRKQKRLVKQVQTWSSIITANIFKALRLLKSQDVSSYGTYPQTIRCLQSIADCHRDTVMRSYTHIADNHKGLLPEQIAELKEVKARVSEMLLTVEDIISNKPTLALNTVAKQNEQLREMTEGLYQKQVPRIRDRSSKTRLSILYYAIIGDARRISRMCVRLIEVFRELHPYDETEEISHAQ